MARTGSSKSSKIFVWGILILLIAGLAGFGINGLGGTIRSIGSVGETEITVNEYARSLQNEISFETRRRGEPVTFLRATQEGIDQRVRVNLAAQAALTEETRAMGLSVGDAQVLRQLNQVPQFQGVDGQFDREAYQFSLRQNGLTTGEFEDGLRSTAARNLLQQAVTGGVTATTTYAETLYNFLSERRSFRWAPIGEDMLVTPVADPTDADLQSYYETNSEKFLTPEIRRVTYAWLTPDMLLETINVDEAELRTFYDERADQYNQPERRLIERLGFADADAAEVAKALLDTGQTTFETLVEERGLTLEDVDQGEVARADLDGAIAEAVFALSEPGVTAPVETSIGPALYRVNAVLEATTVSFEDARAELLAETTADRARRQIEGDIESVDDLLAGGATLEELADETDMQLETLDFTNDATDGIAGYDNFRDELAQLSADDFPEVKQLSDGGIFAVRHDEIVAPAVPPLADIRDDVVAEWTKTQTNRRLKELGGNLLDQLKAGTDMEALGLTPATETDQTRADQIEGAPANLIAEMFGIEENGVALVTGADGLALVELINISPPDLDTDEARSFLNQLTQATSQSLASDVFELFGNATQQRHGLSFNQAAINAVHQQF